MTAKLIGAILIIGACGGFGFSIAAAQLREEACIRSLIRVLDMMNWELQFRLTPLGELCRLGSIEAGGRVGSVFQGLSDELESGVSADVSVCMRLAIERSPAIPPSTKKMLIQLGNCLGRFDLEGQINGLKAVRQGCKEQLNILTSNKEHRLRSYQTLGLCTGAALAIIFI